MGNVHIICYSVETAADKRTILRVSRVECCCAWQDSSDRYLASTRFPHDLTPGLRSTWLTVLDLSRRCGRGIVLHSFTTHRITETPNADFLMEGIFRLAEHSFKHFDLNQERCFSWCAVDTNQNVESGENLMKPRGGYLKFRPFGGTKNVGKSALMR